MGKGFCEKSCHFFGALGVLGVNVSATFQKDDGMIVLGNEMLKLGEGHG